MQEQRALITADEPEIVGDRVRWRGTFHPHGAEPAQVTFAFTCPDPGAFVPSVRPFLLAFLPAAMCSGNSLELDGPIDEGTLAGVREWQAAMAAWHPGVLQAVEVMADTEAERSPASVGEGALTSFSGGVDSAYSAVRHAPGAAPVAGDELVRHTTVTGGLMIHGLDIDVDDHDTFDRAFARSRRMLDSLGIAPHQLWTDIRSLERRWPVDWETTSHGIWLAASLACLEGFFTMTMIPSTYPYGQLRFPWASNPITDPLLGSQARPLWHDGASADKLVKVARIADRKAITDDLRVCWEGARLDRNCGRCFKCTTTQACLWLHGVDRPGAFEVACEPEDLAQLKTDQPYRRHLARRLRDQARSVGRDDIADSLDRALEPEGAPR